MNDEHDRPVEPAHEAEAEALRAWLAGERGDAPAADLVRAARRAADARGRLDEPRAARVAARVLAEVRADSRGAGPARGPVGLVGRVRESLDRSVALRVLAASLLVHLLALPAVGWWWLAPERVPEHVITFRPAPEQEPEAARDGLEDEASATEPVALPPAAARALAAVEARRLDRFRLDTATRPALPNVAGDAGDEARRADYWFTWRVRALDRSRPFAPFDLTRPLDGALALSAQLEAALDRVLRAPEDALARTLVERRLSDLAAATEGDDGPARALWERARDRAVRYGLVDGTQTEPSEFDPTPDGWLAAARPLLVDRPGWRPTLDAR